MTDDEAQAEALRRIARCRDTGCDYLDLGDLGLARLPEELRSLTHLRVLGLGMERITIRFDGTVGWVHDNRRIPRFSDVRSLSEMSGLNTLNLSRCTKLYDLGPLSGLTGLHTLMLSQCTGVNDLGPLSGLLGLQFLEMASFDAVRDLSPLAVLTELRILKLSFCVGLKDLGPLSELFGLQTLDLSGCESVSELGPLSGLSRLHTVSLSQCKRVSELSPLSGLSRLHTLHLTGCKNVSNLQPLSNLTNLHTLKLINCECVSDLGPLSGLSGLRTLNLSTCKAVSDVGPLSGLIGLQTLDLSACKGIRFEPLRPLLQHLHVLRLWGAPFVDLAPQVYIGGSTQKSALECIVAHYADLDAGSQPDSEIKLFVLGNGGVGKTQLGRRLRNKPYDENEPSTHGVKIHSFPLPRAGDDPVRINLWDFGGQDIYHGSHALFIDGHAVFVILWHPDFETGSLNQGGVAMTNRSLPYWLDYVRSEAGPDAVVLIVQARCDQRGDEHALPPVDLGDLRVRTLAVSACTDRGLDVFEAELRLAVRDLMEARPPYQIGVGRAKVRDRLRKWTAADQDRPPETRKHRTLSVAEFTALCKEVGGVSSADALLSFLTLTGVLFYRPGKFDDRIILDQQWALDAIYTVFDRTRVLPVFRDHGRFTRTDLAHLAWQEHSSDEQELFLGMMEQCDICFRSGERRVGQKVETVYVAPELLPDDRDTIDRVLAGRMPSDPPIGIATARFRFLHDGVLRSVLAKIGRTFVDHATYWKWGCFLYEKRTDTRALVEAARSGPDDGPGGGTITIQVWGQQTADVQKALLQVVKESAGRSEPEWRTQPVDDRPVKPDFVFPGGEEREYGRLVPGDPPESATVIAFSYGHGDNRDDKGRNRGAFVDGLEAAMHGWGYSPLRDVNELTNCGLIREFVRTIAGSRRVVLVLTEKYLKSVYCMCELHAVYLESRKVRADFADKVVPCLIEDDLKIDTWDGRADWADHWRSVYERMESRVKSLGQTDLNQWYEIGQWVRDVSDMLVYVSNMVTQRGFGTLTANGYEAVKAMLDRPNRGA